MHSVEEEWYFVGKVYANKTYKGIIKIEKWAGKYRWGFWTSLKGTDKQVNPGGVSTIAGRAYENDFKDLWSCVAEARKAVRHYLSLEEPQFAIPEDWTPLSDLSIEYRKNNKGIPW